MDRKDDGFIMNNPHQFNERSQARITRNDVRHYDRKSNDTRHSIDSMKFEKQEYSKYSATEKPFQNDTSTAGTPICTRYKCISEKMYKDLKAVKDELKNRSRLCCVAHCSELQRIEDENDLHAYVEHLINQHPCIIEEEITNAEELRHHRLEHHTWEAPVGLHIEEFERMRIYKIVRYQNQTKSELSECKQPIEESHVIITDRKESKRDIPIAINEVFMCKRHCIPIELGTKEDAVGHHNKHHSNEPFQSSLQQFKRNFFKSEFQEIPEHRTYLFECFYCKTLFASIASYNEHACEPKFKKFGPHFIAHKLVACHIDRTIETYEQLEKHFISEHPFFYHVEFNPVDIFDSGKCGLCDYSYTNIDDLQGHYVFGHKKGEIATKEFLDSMQLLEFNIDECHFAPVCCPEFKTKGIEETIQRMCQRHFTCDNCKNLNCKFDIIISLINHHVAGKTHKETLEWLQNLKLVSTLLKDTQITLPNGFTAPIKNIEYPNFEAKLQQKLHEKVIEISKKFQNQNGIQKNHFIYFTEKFVNKS